MVECGDECKSLPTQIIVKNVVTYFVMKKKKNVVTVCYVARLALVFGSNPSQQPLVSGSHSLLLYLAIYCQRRNCNLCLTKNKYVESFTCLPFAVQL